MSQQGPTWQPKDQMDEQLEKLEEIIKEFDPDALEEFYAQSMVELPCLTPLSGKATKEKVTQALTPDDFFLIDKPLLKPESDLTTHHPNELDFDQIDFEPTKENKASNRKIFLRKKS